MFETANLKPDDTLPGSGRTVADELLAVHRSYGPAVQPLLKNPDLHALAHITGGGFTGNIDRMLPPDLDAVVHIDSWDMPPLFRFLALAGSLTDHELYRTFNMGVGMVLIVDSKEADSISKTLVNAGETVYAIGEVVKGSREVHIVRGT